MQQSAESCNLKIEAFQHLSNGAEMFLLKNNVQKIFRYNILFLIGFIVTIYYLSSEAGTPPGLSFLRLPLDARSGAMGGTGISLQIFPWSSKELLKTTSSVATFTHIRGITDTDTEFLGIIINRGKSNAVGLSILSNNIGNIEFRTRPTAAPEGIISAHDIFAGISYFRTPQEGIQFCITARYLYQKIFFNTASGYSTDIGVRYIPKNSKLSFGAGVYNLGSMEAFISEKPVMPTMARIGAQYALLSRSDVSHRLVCSTEYERLFSVRDISASGGIGKNSGHFGIEYQYRSILCFQCGYVTGYEEQGFSVGAGIAADRIKFDYAYLPDRSSIGNQHIVTIHCGLTTK